jgi:Class III cytochrome C family
MQRWFNARSRMFMVVAAASSILLIAGAVSWSQVAPTAPQPAKAASAANPATSAATLLTAKRFVHADHTKHGVDVAVCTTCHTIDPRGVVAVPAALGHSPCQNAACHAADFVASGAKTKKADPARHQKAVAFCLGCHSSVSNSAPNAWNKAVPDAAFKGVGDYHVEMNHLDHTARMPCRDCHAVDGVSYKLLENAPGHRQCVLCHNGKPVPAMTECGMCHKTPAASAYFTSKRPDSDVRSCGAASSDPKSPCFKHERKEHRFCADNRELQCGNCHFMVAETGLWNGRSYKSLKDVKSAPIIENQKDRAHKACGSSGCHSADVNDGAGRARCGLCHSKKVLDSIFQ